MKFVIVTPADYPDKLNTEELRQALLAQWPTCALEAEQAEGRMGSNGVHIPGHIVVRRLPDNVADATVRAFISSQSFTESDAEIREEVSTIEPRKLRKVIKKLKRDVKDLEDRLAAAGIP
jgi:predicted AlkP superfamily phosphohydrolase/phosphomutase